MHCLFNDVTLSRRVTRLFPTGWSADHFSIFLQTKNLWCYKNKPLMYAFIVVSYLLAIRIEK